MRSVIRIFQNLLLEKCETFCEGLTKNVNEAAKKREHSGMFPNAVWTDCQKYLYCYLFGTLMVTIESQWNSAAENHCEQDPGM